MELWLKHSSAFTYADDSSSSVKDKTIDGVIHKLEEDAQNFFKFMASNGLVANPSRPTLIILNFKSAVPILIKIGDSIVQQEEEAKLLGAKICENQKWNKQISGTGGSCFSSQPEKLLNQKTVKSC